ncbi:sugar transferase [Nereida sp. MMG025]|uniref:sugar transferase n=1 Tax=Nereida sp. MMG025 TaxID=2909981 RepID=UPI001F3F52C6|nr:sugar transferase [Nereida sp. MMG025]MCF6445720.1 sugar transferase [Nereida sp. MMG025]
MTERDKVIKRGFDFTVALCGLLVLWPVIAVTWVLARRDTGASGFFVQERIGQHGQPFRVVKLRTMRNVGGTTVTTANDARITPLGAKLRRYKLDELPQLWNVLKGEMSFVGPRPDVAGYMDLLPEEDRVLLSLRPGITGPATLKYRREEEVLAQQDDPQAYNDTVIWPDKVRINREYLANWSLATDLRLIKETILK